MALKAILFAGPILLALAALLFVLNRGRAGAEQDAQMTAAYVPDPNNHTVVFVRGWSRSELERILTDFQRLYSLNAASMKVEGEATGQLAIKFPQDIQPK